MDTWTELQGRASKEHAVPQSFRVYCYASIDAALGARGDELVPSISNAALWAQYFQRAEALSAASPYRVHFAGHLARSRPFDVAVGIKEALALLAKLPEAKSYPQAIPPVSLSHQTDHKKAAAMTVNVVISVYREPLHWLKGLCSSLASVENTRIGFYIYSKHAQNTLAGIRPYLEGCAASCEVTQLPNVGREGHSWLVYMLTRAAVFGDVNIFFQGSRESRVDTLRSVVRRLKTLLFDRAQATGAINHVHDIDTQDFGGLCPLVSMAKLASDQYMSNSSGHLNRLHFIATAKNPVQRPRPGFPFTSRGGAAFSRLMHDEYCEWVHSGINKTVPLSDCMASYKSFRGEHIVTGVGLHRALARHRTLLKQIYDGLQGSSAPIAGHGLERLWLTIFHGVVRPETCGS